jgi:hypothetical protein
MRQAYYQAPISKLLSDSPQTILGHLAEHHGHDLEQLQRHAWLEQIALLQRELKGNGTGWIALEFRIPRMGKRVDAVVILGSVVFAIEFKIGTDRFDRSAKEQVVDYALDLKNFHAVSHDKRIVPVLVATGADKIHHSICWSHDGVAEVVTSNGEELGTMLHTIANTVTNEARIDPALWAASGYKPTPTIIEAAQALYQGHQVDEITRADAGAKNLTQTTSCVAGIIEDAKANRKKVICFVTGVPGAGKTLAALNLVTQRTKAHVDEHAVFLSGNGPLVEVLREALARDEKERSNGEISKADAARKIRSFIQNIHHFRDEGLSSQAAPIERVAVFDEAQRAWDLRQIAKFMLQKKGRANFDMSESEFLISVMDRHKDWCAVVCFVGGGQEINSGEAGLPEWFSALRKRFRDWKVYLSPAITHQDYHWGQDSADMLRGLNVTVMPQLHLSVSVRSFRAEKLSDFVGALITGDADEARSIHNEIKDSYPIILTRNLAQARAWLIKQARGTERIGFVASSGASRLKPEGLNVHEKIDARYWFLNDRTDVRSSYYLEDPATEFDAQGLEVDWVGVCWDANFRYLENKWSYHAFRGTNWQNVISPTQQTYLANAYRVLLTRARQGIVIYVPEGDGADPTRNPLWYQATSEFLQRCGVPKLPTVT